MSTGMVTRNAPRCLSESGVVVEMPDNAGVPEGEAKAAGPDTAQPGLPETRTKRDKSPVNCHPLFCSAPLKTLLPFDLH